jgi:hypothetical protein
VTPLQNLLGPVQPPPVPGPTLLYCRHKGAGGLIDRAGCQGDDALPAQSYRVQTEFRCRPSQGEVRVQTGHLPPTPLSSANDATGQRLKIPGGDRAPGRYGSRLLTTTTPLLGNPHDRLFVPALFRSSQQPTSPAVDPDLGGLCGRLVPCRPLKPAPGMGRAVIQRHAFDRDAVRGPLNRRLGVKMGLSKQRGPAQGVDRLIPISHMVYEGPRRLLAVPLSGSSRVDAGTGKCRHA